MGGFRNRTEKYSILNVVSIKQTHCSTPKYLPGTYPIRANSWRSVETGVEKRRKGCRGRYLLLVGYPVPRGKNRRKG